MHFSVGAPGDNALAIGTETQPVFAELVVHVADARDRDVGLELAGDPTSRRVDDQQLSASTNHGHGLAVGAVLQVARLGWERYGLEMVADALPIPKDDLVSLGAGSNCQLQLGGDDIPILHSILLVNEEGAHIDAVVPWPQLIVNGTPQRTADLHDGDQFTIGKFEFAVHEQRPAAAGQALAMTPAADLPDVPESEDLASLSVAAIVERIERDQRQVEQFDTARESGALALLQAAKQAARDREGDSPVSADELLRELQDLSRELDRRARLLAQREAECAERAANLLKVHDEISEQMEEIGARLGEPEVPYLQRQAS